MDHLLYIPEGNIDPSESKTRSFLCFDRKKFLVQKKKFCSSVSVFKEAADFTEYGGFLCFLWVNITVHREV